MRRWVAVLASSLCGLHLGAPAAGADPSLTGLWRQLAGHRFVDLTHAFEPGIPHWPGFPDERREVLYSYVAGEGTRGSGFKAELYSHVGQWGTHVDPPSHFVEGLRTVDQITPGEMFLPLVVLDIHVQAARNPDYTVRLRDVEDWEKRNGRVPERAFVALRTDWSKRWPDAAAMANRDAAGLRHYPGWSLEVLRFLYEQRHVTASGHETTDTDPGIAVSRDDYSLERYVLSRNHYQIELLAGLDQVPEAGALAIVTFPKPLHGSGFPARVIAIVP
jgi:kynurenine formamidase